MATSTSTRSRTKAPRKTVQVSEIQQLAQRISKRRYAASPQAERAFLKRQLQTLTGELPAS